MPHLIVEYSAGLERSVDIDRVLELAGDAAAESGVMARADIKLRAIAYSHFKLLDGGDSFVHLSVRLLAGRNAEQKLQLSSLLRERLAAYLTSVHSISVEIVDMDAQSYRKRLL
ncbi:5-carboxymethyl-2-hydroxymuconate Delta-isomerase [Solimonas flava]|uniref:5-carboxymethyl-2-hydroxymuconate Delta-isomerase n=1 Tax=Solimonas flava TaxID=415849 RepID=UPI000421DAEA|nr:5-carboxymethyl-2-hydroxymuconate Delta-isomerase [Solimonas flava]